MRIRDYGLLLLLGIMLLLAVRHMVRAGKKKKGCDGSCGSCSRCG